MDTFDVDTVIAGAGVIGIAIARALALAGKDVLLLEKNALIGEETSARNSEVIHAGIYYDPRSLKAQHCLRGKALLYAFCEERVAPYRRCGKMIVATDDQEAEKLTSIVEHARANGVDDLTFLDGREAMTIEPALTAVAALRSPSTGIVDSHALMLALLGEAEAHGAQTLLRARIIGGEVKPDGQVRLDIGGPAPMRLRARSFVNAAGLWATDLTRRIEGMPPAPDLEFVKGNYFTLSGKAPFSQLIYPVPRDGGLGVHLTLDLGGQAKFGPDTDWLADSDPAHIDYGVDETRRAAFAAAIRQYWKDVREEDLLPGYSGVRPKIAGAAYPDFRIEGPGSHEVGPHVFLYGIESPGLTACLSIAETVARMLG
ncbi:NAD(P)/FAD-dependent oxidoreductase [Aliiroseovarius subalbicans]|uniref:NAD(P)/FAD-dependent oxidoreductase n=1 Tax=Aliiroseovarius subalbicans TaxID=2925840 RepID=UPI001F58EF79|nr:NAD(P)/FAD-dependent oxidoreductase [uncultured Aliiroseovarius sp.]MCI2401169.1 NAD(P)/FAD-dependent oxidoreductase [Aliiroseovarius subalbicans]